MYGNEEKRKERKNKNRIIMTNNTEPIGTRKTNKTRKGKKASNKEDYEEKQ